jgi:NAD(P)H-dependent FMN reductase
MSRGRPLHPITASPPDDHPPLKLAVILGSVRQGRFGEVVTNWFAGLAKEHSAFDVEVVDLSETELPPALHEARAKSPYKPEA